MFFFLSFHFYLKLLVKQRLDTQETDSNKISHVIYISYYFPFQGTNFKEDYFTEPFKTYSDTDAY